MAEDIIVWKGGKAVPSTRTAEQLPEITPADLDAKASRAATKFMDENPETVALGMVIADLAEIALGVDQATARQQIKTKFESYYRALLG